jgi:predicted O-methyltransferase YrrM
MTENKISLLSNLYRAILHREPKSVELQRFEVLSSNDLDLDKIVCQLMGTAEFKTVQDKLSKLLIKPGHFYSPIVNVEEIKEAFLNRTIPESLPGIDIDNDSMMRLWNDLLPYLNQIPFPEVKSDDYRYFFKNPAFSYGDGSILYAMLRHFKPKRYVEIGSGFSSGCAVDTNALYFDDKISMSFIEPYPQLLKQVLGESGTANVKIHSVNVQQADLEIFKQLESGDVLFIDSTHVLKTGSDVCYELFEVLPILKPGVIIHFHDIFWPFEYGKKWVLVENRSWNEIYALRAFLMNNDNYKILFFNDWFRRFYEDKITLSYPAFLRNTGGSIWIKKLSNF